MQTMQAIKIVISGNTGMNHFFRKMSLHPFAYGEKRHDLRICSLNIAIHDLFSSKHTSRGLSSTV
jgi:hypothetical protein